jgi:hypothetical protein
MYLNTESGDDSSTTFFQFDLFSFKVHVLKPAPFPAETLKGIVEKHFNQETEYRRYRKKDGGHRISIIHNPHPFVSLKWYINDQKPAAKRFSFVGLKLQTSISAASHTNAKLIQSKCTPNIEYLDNNATILEFKEDAILWKSTIPDLNRKVNFPFRQNEAYRRIQIESISGLSKSIRSDYLQVLHHSGDKHHRRIHSESITSTIHKMEFARDYTIESENFDPEHFRYLFSHLGFIADETDSNSDSKYHLVSSDKTKGVALKIYSCAVRGSQIRIRIEFVVTGSGITGLGSSTKVPESLDGLENFFHRMEKRFKHKVQASIGAINSKQIRNPDEIRDQLGACVKRKDLPWIKTLADHLESKGYFWAVGTWDIPSKYYLNKLRENNLIVKSRVAKLYLLHPDFGIYPTLSDIEFP